MHLVKNGPVGVAATLSSEPRADISFSKAVKRHALGLIKSTETDLASETSSLPHSAINGDKERGDRDRSGRKRKVVYLYFIYPSCVFLRFRFSLAVGPLQHEATSEKDLDLSSTAPDATSSAPSHKRRASTRVR